VPFAGSHRINCILIQPLLLRVLADNGSTPPNRLKTLVRTELRDRPWSELLLRLAGTWNERRQDQNASERWLKEPENWHRGILPVHDGGQFYGSDLWESFMLPEAVCAKVDGREAEFCREAVELAQVVLEPEMTFEKLARTFLARWRNATSKLPLPLEANPAEPESVPDSASWSQTVSAFECLAHRKWMNSSEPESRRPKSESSTQSGKRQRQEPAHPKSAKPKMAQKSIWDFLNK
jgi:hypothetical protein